MHQAEEGFFSYKSQFTANSNSKFYPTVEVSGGKGHPPVV